MNQNKAMDALKKAETLLKQNFTITGEVKLFPLALMHLQNAINFVWESKRKKPEIMKEIEMLIQKKEESTTEFVRGNKLILCTDKYTITTLEEKTIQELIIKTRKYIESLNNE